MTLGLCGPIDTMPLRDCFEHPECIPEGLGGSPVTALVRAALDRNWRVAVFSLDPQVRTETVFRGASGRLTLSMGPFRERGRARDFFRAERDALSQAIERERPDVIHAHWTYEFALGALDSGLPTVVTAHDRPLRVLRWDHSPYRLVRTAMAAMVARRARHMTAVSTPVAEHFRRYFCRRGAPQLRVIPNAIDDRWFAAPQRQPRALRGDAGVVFASVLSGWGKLKNGATLLAAFASVRRANASAQLWMFGHGHGEDEGAAQWAKVRGLAEGVRFIGQVPADRLRAMLRRADILVHPSLEESLSMATAEAMALGLPVIAARQGAVIAAPEWSLLADGDSPDSLAEAMSRLSRDGDLRAEFGRSGRRVAAATFRATAVFDQYADVYRSVHTQ